ncbi:hypothetical protein ABIC98_004084, partial [Arthrobacter nitrophenolicus]
TDNMKEKNQPESLASNLSVPTSLLTTTLRTDIELPHQLHQGY